MDREELFNDGVNLLNTLFKKFIELNKISDGESYKYFINYPDSYHHVDYYDFKLGRVLICFPIYYSSNEESAECYGNIYVSLEDNLNIVKFETISEKVKESEEVVTKKLLELKFERNREMIENLANLYYYARSIQRFEKNSPEYNRTTDLYLEEIDKYKGKLKELNGEILDKKEEIEAKDNVQMEGIKSTDKSVEDKYEQLIERLDAGNSENKKYDFSWDESLLFNFADEASLEVAFNLIERGQISLSCDIEKRVMNITSMLYGFCNANMTNEDFFKECEKDNSYNSRKDEPYTWKYNMNLPMSMKNAICTECKYQSCPKVLAAYILYLKNQGLLKEKLITREKFRKENNVGNGFFLFEWKNKNGLKRIDEKIFEFANELVNKDYVRLERCLKDGKIKIIALCSCRDIQLCNMDITKIIPRTDWSRLIYITRNPNHEPDNLCGPYICRLPSCALVVAGYIYYLKMSGQENKIIEDRNYYYEHKDEIDKEIEEKVKRKIEALKSKKEEKIKDFKDTYEGKIENLNLTINSIFESDRSNFHCIVAGDDDGERNSFIEKIISLLQQENPEIKEVRRIPVIAFTSFYRYDTSVRINKQNELVYDDVSPAEMKESPNKRDRNGFIFQSGTIHRIPELEDNAIYVLDGIKEFISVVREAKDDYKVKYNIRVAIEALTNISLTNYIILNANKDEVDSFVALDQRIKFVYQNNIITLPTYSIDDMFDSHIGMISPDLVETIRENEEEYKRKFCEYVSVNRNFMPFNKREIVNYISTYVNTRNELVLPPNVYKKENLDNLIGLNEVKEKLKEFEKFMLFQVQAKANDINMMASNMHMIFTGNPGTGKTTVARIMAKMLFDLGVIKENKLVEVERKDLVGRFIGQTAIKTTEVIDKALGGVLFIDEAYTLAVESDNDFGKEAIATLVKAMEDHKDELVVIFAGYRNEMKKFTDTNPGISSRIGYTFDFPDYSVDELVQIFYLKLKNSGFEIEDNVEVPLKRLCDYYSKRKNFGNGRFVDKVIQETLMNHAIKSSDNINLITKTDIPTIEELNQNEYNNNSETAEEMLSHIIGMENIKQEVMQFANYARFVKMAEEKKIKIPDTNMHMIFTGNPGTGKTTIARIIAKILFDMEIIHENKLIEVERKDLVAGYVGQTAIKTNEVIEKAMGGVLFIDEAYSLTQGRESQYDFGAEAIATLIKAMEDHKGEFVVIFAGYRDEMKTFVDMNPGISSRIGYTFNFEDYSVRELMDMFYLKMKLFGFELSEDVELPIQRACEYYSKRKNFGNGRFVDKLIQKTLLKHANLNSENIEVISAMDIPTIEELNQNTIKNSEQIKEMLSQIVGMKDLKKEILSLGDYIRFVKEAEKQKINIPDASLHMIFTGNPGTGKTTIARIIAKMLFDMEVIHENKLIEVERKDLIGQYVGHTAPKTNDVIEKAMGGVLFIDEAYSLTQGKGSQYDFGAEAIATLIKAMEDHKGEFVVIFAGYKNEMKEFVDSNPGIASRIGYTFNFKDYEPDELTEIFVKKVEKTGMTLAEDAKEKVLKVMRYFSNVENFGNGRFVDKVFHQTIMKHSKVLKEDISIITQEDIPEINEMTKIMLGGEKMIDVRKITDEALRKTAVHEVGHATAQYLLTEKPNIKKITINAEGTGTLGYVRREKWRGSYTPGKTALLNDVKVCLAGLACEKVFYGEYENGGSSDLESATSIVYNMITRYGMSDIGLAKVTNPSGEVEKAIWDEENRMLKECFEDVQKLLLNNKENIERVVDYLMEHTEINEEEFIKVFNENNDIGSSPQ